MHCRTHVFGSVAELVENNQLSVDAGLVGVLAVDSSWMVAEQGLVKVGFGCTAGIVIGCIVEIVAGLEAGVAQQSVVQSMDSVVQRIGSVGEAAGHNYFGCRIVLHMLLVAVHMQELEFEPGPEVDNPQLVDAVEQAGTVVVAEVGDCKSELLAVNTARRIAGHMLAGHMLADTEDSQPVGRSWVGLIVDFDILAEMGIRTS